MGEKWSSRLSRGPIELKNLFGPQTKFEKTFENFFWKSLKNFEKNFSKFFSNFFQIISEIISDFFQFFGGPYFRRKMPKKLFFRPKYTNLPKIFGKEIPKISEKSERFLNFHIFKLSKKKSHSLNNCLKYFKEIFKKFRKILSSKLFQIWGGHIFKKKLF